MDLLRKGKSVPSRTILECRIKPKCSVLQENIKLPTKISNIKISNAVPTTIVQNQHYTWCIGHLDKFKPQCPLMTPFALYNGLLNVY